MATTFITTATTSSVSLVSGDALYVTAMGSITRNGIAITGTQGGADIFVDGDVVGSTFGIRILGAGSNVITIAEDGAVNAGNVAMQLFGSSNLVTNHGSILVLKGQGIIAASTSNELINTGLISVSGDVSGTVSTAVQLGNNATLFNSGTITSNFRGLITGFGSEVDNSGVIYGASFGVTFASGVSELRNSGEISSAETAVSAGFGRVVNSGLISGDLAVSGGQAIVNTGTLQGTTGISVNGINSTSRIINSGTISVVSIAIEGEATKEVTNSGTILSTGIGIESGTENGLIVNNSGVIATDSGAVFSEDTLELINSGTITAGGDAISVAFGDQTSIKSMGSIIAAGTAVKIQFDGNHYVANHGQLSGGEYGIQALELYDASIFVNTGTIDGNLSSILLTNRNASSAYGHEINNRGLIIGDVQMSDGGDLYYGKWGTVEGDIFLGGGDDTASGGDQGERIEGGDGIDRIFGFGGDDNLFGDAGNDVLRGGDGDDGVNGGADNDDLGGGAGNDVLLGADGNDLLRGDMGADVLNGGDGFDRANYGDSSTGITIDLADTGLSTGFAQGDSYTSIEAYEATDFADIMFGDDVNNLLRGMDGDDQISGRGGNDNLQGFDGDDILSGGTGNDTLNGGDGTDVAAFTGDLADYTFTLLGNGNIRVEDTVGSDGIDVLVAVEFVTFNGGAEIDVTGLI